MTEFAIHTASTTWLKIIQDGSDLGSNFDHRDGYLYFLFGDTPAERGNPDPIGRTDAATPDDGLRVDLLDFLAVEGVSQEEFEVPTGGVSIGGRLYVFFTTGHYVEDGREVMGRCVLASAALPTDRFQVDVEVDSMPGHGPGGVGKFINVCPRIIRAGEHPQIGFLDGVMMWGSGRYRSSDVYLAFAELDNIGSKQDWLYYTGDPFPNDWRSGPEGLEAAMPLLDETDVGELSVAFIPGLGQWIMLYGSALNPIGAQIRMAPNPWGPWTKPPPTGVLSLADNAGPNGAVRPNGAFDPATVSGPYGFYIIDRYTRWDAAAGQATLWFPVSENNLPDGAYRTHLVGAVVQFEALPPDTLPPVEITVVADAIKDGDTATAVLSLTAPFGWDLAFDLTVPFPGLANVRTDSATAAIKAGDTTAQFQLLSDRFTGFQLKPYRCRIDASYSAPQLTVPPANAEVFIDVESSIEGGILGSISLPSATLRAGASIQAQLVLEGPVAVPTDVSVGAFDPPGDIVLGQTDVVTLSTDVVTVPTGSTIGQFEIHAHDVPSAREVILIASAVGEKRARLTVEPR